MLNITHQTTSDIIVKCNVTMCSYSDHSLMIFKVLSPLVRSGSDWTLPQMHRSAVDPLTSSVIIIVAVKVMMMVSYILFIKLISSLISPSCSISLPLSISPSCQVRWLRPPRAGVWLRVLFSSPLLCLFGAENIQSVKTKSLRRF